MSRSRKPEQDRAATRDVILGKRDRKDGKVNWLGHQVGSGNDRMDQLLLEGATWEELASCRATVRNQLYHLEKDHGLHIEDCGGTYRFDRRRLGLTSE